MSRDGKNGFLVTKVRIKEGVMIGENMLVMLSKVDGKSAHLVFVVDKAIKVKRLDEGDVLRTLAALREWKSED